MPFHHSKLPIPAKEQVSCAFARAFKGPNSKNVESNSIETDLRAQVDSFAVFVSPSHVVRVLWTDDRPEVLILRIFAAPSSEILLLAYGR